MRLGDDGDPPLGVVTAELCSLSALWLPVDVAEPLRPNIMGVGGLELELMVSLLSLLLLLLTLDTAVLSIGR